MKYSINPDNLKHPVSGNRQFGIRAMEGDMNFVRSADRLSQDFDEWAGGVKAFKSADALWKGFQNNLVNFISDNEGQAEIDEKKYEWKRCNWLTK